MQVTHTKAFTLVELIVVIVILWVLSTIGFVSYNGYLWGARDSNRVTQLKNISDSLTLYATDKNLPLPDDYVTVLAGSNVVGYQWYAGQNTLELINYTNGGIDPKDDTYFTYYLSADRKKVQLLAFLEETDNLQANTNIKIPWVAQTYAADYSNRFAKVYGKKLWVMTLTSNKQPIQEVGTIATAGSLDISTAAVSYTAHMSDNTSDNISGTGGVLVNITPNASCKRIKEVGDSNGSGRYNINPTGTGSPFEVYCDMENGWGGWTMIGSKVSDGNQDSGDFWTILIEPGKSANVRIFQDSFRNNIVDMMACSSDNCWTWILGEVMRSDLQSWWSTLEDNVVKRVSGTTSLTSFNSVTSRYSHAWSSNFFELLSSSTTGIWSWSWNRRPMDWVWSSDTWTPWDKWELYVR